MKLGPAVVAVTTVVAITLAMLLASAPLAAADVYRCVSDSGVVSYSDRPCGEKSEKTGIKSDRTDRKAVEERRESREEQIRELQESEEEAQRSAEQAKEAAEQRKTACAAARTRLEQLVTARRMSVGEGEERRYLDDAEMIERRQQAQDKVNELCTDD